MPCGVVWYGFGAKVAGAAWLPEVRPAAPACWWTFCVPFSTIQTSPTLLRLR
jgi:hypothetical protein